VSLWSQLNLKPDRWFTLVYKHKDLSLWQTIVAACEDSGLHYMNAVWQDLKIPSTRQIESPNINPQGDMYLNFRKISQRRFEFIYGQAPVLELPTRANYVEHEIERLIVAYLGADIELITSGVVQQVLDSRAFKNYRVNPKDVTEDIEKVLKGPKFVTWQPDGGTVFWVIAPDISLDSSLDAKDRVRYYIFDLLRQKSELDEGTIRRHLLTQLSQEHDLEPIFSDVTAMLHSIAREVRPHIWQFDVKKVTSYKQLRLFFRPSRADRIREQIERHQGQSAEKPLLLNPEGFAQLRDLLSKANSNNPQFEALYNRLQEVLLTVLRRLEDDFENQIERVMAVGDWVRYGIDLRDLPYDDVIIQIVLRSSERPFKLYQQVAKEVFADLQDEDIFVQFRLMTLPEWQYTESFARAGGKEEALGIVLLNR